MKRNMTPVAARTRTPVRTKPFHKSVTPDQPARRHAVHPSACAAFTYDLAFRRALRPRRGSDAESVRIIHGPCCWRRQSATTPSRSGSTPFRALAPKFDLPSRLTGDLPLVAHVPA